MTELQNPFPYTLLRSNRQTLTLELNPKGALTVYAPQKMPLKQIETVLREKEPWIRRKRTLLMERAEVLDRFSPAPGGRLPYLGQELTMSATDSARPFLQEGILFLPRQGDPAANALAWFTQNARQVLPIYVDKWARTMNVFPSSLAFGHARHRWGSMSSTGSLRLNVALLHCPPRFIDYVVVHELCHRLHPDHSPAFHASVESVLPDAPALRAQGKDLSFLLELLRP